jgi:hypothetical protein
MMRMSVGCGVGGQAYARRITRVHGSLPAYCSFFLAFSYLVVGNPLAGAKTQARRVQGPC